MLENIVFQGFVFFVCFIRLEIGKGKKIYDFYLLLIFDGGCWGHTREFEYFGAQGVLK